MPIINSNQASRTGRPASLLLTSARVTEGYRDALFAAAAARGLTPTDFLLIAATDHLVGLGYPVPGVFQAGDLPTPQKDQAA